jgi:NarL family two-component system sensor histidine kinase LiaS
MANAWAVERYMKVLNVEHKATFLLSPYLGFLFFVCIAFLMVIAALCSIPALRYLATFMLAGSAACLFLAALHLSRQVSRLSQSIDEQEQLITQRQRYLIAAEIHETITPLLFTTTLITHAMLAHEATCLGEIAASLKDLHQLASTTHKAIRHVLLALRPARISEIPLDRLITELVQIKRFCTETNIQCTAIGTAHYPPHIHQSLYRIVDLALSNSVLHAQASSILVRLFLSQDEAIISVEDDGCGFNHEDIKPGHFGLHDIETCARGIGAALSWHTLPGSHPKKLTCIWRKPSWS